MSTEQEPEPAPEPPERSERTIERVTRVVDRCRGMGFDAKPARDMIERTLEAGDLLREQAEGAGLKQRERRILGSAVAEGIREGME